MSIASYTFLFFLFFTVINQGTKNIGQWQPKITKIMHPKSLDSDSVTVSEKSLPTAMPVTADTLFNLSHSLTGKSTKGVRVSQ